MNGAKFLEVTSKIQSMKPDMAIITESEITVGDTPIVPGYTTFLPKMSESVLVRVIMFIKNEHHAEQIFTSALDIQMVAAKVGSSAFVGIYRQFSMVTKSGTVRSSVFESEQLNNIIEEVRAVSDRHKSLYLAGDFNLDIARADDPNYYKQHLLHRWTAFTEELGLRWSETGPTFMSDGIFNGEHRFSTIDHVYARTRYDVTSYVLPDLTSDHRPVLARVSGVQARKKRQTRQDRNWSAMDKDALEMFLLQWDWDTLLTCTNVNEAVSKLKEATTAAIDVAVPLKKYTTPNLDVRLKPDTRAAMKMRDKAKREGREHYKVLRNKVLKLVRRDFVQHNLNRIRQQGQKAAWQIVSEVSGKEKGSSLPLPNDCQTDREAATMANNYYIEKVNRLRENVNSHPIATAEMPKDTGFRFHCVGTAAVKRALQKLALKTAVGVDNVPITVFKAAWSALAMPLVHVVNLVITKGEWPNEWKESLITPVLKKGKPRLEIGSYRPVALLCAVSKLVERVLYNQLIDHVESQGLLPPEQHGYRRNRGVDTALASMLLQVARAIDKGLKVGLSAFDYSAAFDTVEPSVLNRKLAWASGKTRKLLLNYMTAGRQRVKWNGTLSEINAVLYGVRQGSVLGPLLFVLLTGDLPRTVIKSVTPENKVSMSLYADDTSTLVATRAWEETDKIMQETATVIEEYSKDNGLCLNAGKTQVLKLSHRETPPNYTLDLLGVKLNKSAGFSAHHEGMLADLKRRVGVIRRLATKMPNGKLLTEIANSLVIGKLQTSAWVTRSARFAPGPQHGCDKATQVILNDLARLLLGVKRADRYRTSDLSDRAGVPTLNEIVVRQSCVAAWKAEQGGPLNDALEVFDDRTRGSSDNMRRAASARCKPACNMASAWNASESLRLAKTLQQAQTAAKKLARSVRHL